MTKNRHESEGAEAARECEQGPHVRRCFVTREQAPPERMIRFVISPAGEVVADLAARLPGRGFWLSARRDVLETARTRHLFSKVARRPVKVSEDLVCGVARLILMRIAQGLGLARRAGEAVCGFEQCREWVVANKAGLLIHATGASFREIERLRSGGKQIPTLALAEEMLAAVFGRERVIYGAIAHGALAQRLRIEHERFSGLTDGLVPSPLIRSGREQAGI